MCMCACVHVHVHVHVHVCRADMMRSTSLQCANLDALVYLTISKFLEKVSEALLDACDCSIHRVQSHEFCMQTPYNEILEPVAVQRFSTQGLHYVVRHSFLFMYHFT